MNNLVNESKKLDIKQVDIKKLISLMLCQSWHKDCDIIPEYIRPLDKNKKKIVVIKYNNGTEHPPFLRYSMGPNNIFFWDIYGEDFQSVELAIIALSKAPAPVSVAPIEFSLK